ncbi:hypothetical protein GQ53DRAFT_851456 [Thozetella sp. PMI_491]|nr:hypothetical protein GQ53DRAFT_851456 [Thozetella sp. PMI_491]
MAQNSAASNYATFSNFIATDPELSIYRSFQTLGSRNLLHLQSALIELEARLKEVDAEDAQDPSLDAMLSSKCWETFSARSKEHPREAERMELVNQIKSGTKEYYEALLIHSQVMNLPKPSRRVFRVFSGWFQSEKPFVGYSSDLLHNRNDLVALTPPTDQDILTRSLQTFAGRYMPGTRHEHSEDVKYYSATRISRLVTVVTVVAASLIIEGAIVTLYFITDESLRLGLIALFTTLFAASLALMTDGRRTDIILATAACSAVLVVFVSQSSS